MEESKIKAFRKEAEEYGCSEHEIKHVERILSDWKTNIVFTFEQFKVFYNYWRRYLNMTPYMGSFLLYPKDNGLQLGCHWSDPDICMKPLALSTVLYKPEFGPRFIQDLDRYWNFVKDSHGKLVVLSMYNVKDSRLRDQFDMYGGPRLQFFIGGGRIYSEPHAQPMGSLEEMYHSRYSKNMIYDPKERYLIIRNKR